MSKFWENAFFEGLEASITEDTQWSFVVIFIYIHVTACYKNRKNLIVEGDEFFSKSLRYLLKLIANAQKV